jgi:hypothetical protein
MKVCGWRVRGPGWWASACSGVGLCGSSFRFCLVGRGWPTPVHGSGFRVQHDETGFGADASWRATLGRKGSCAWPLVLPKGAWTVSTLTSALWTCLWRSASGFSTCMPPMHVLALGAHGTPPRWKWPAPSAARPQAVLANGSPDGVSSGLPNERRTSGSEWRDIPDFASTAPPRPADATAGVPATPQTSSGTSLDGAT